MSDAAFALPSWKLDVDFVCNNGFLPPINNQNNTFSKANFTNRKTKFVSAHPTLPLLLSLDECANVSLWNTQLKQLVWQSSGFSLQKESILQQYHAQNIPKEANKQFSLKSKHASLARINGPAMRNLGNIHIPNFAPLPSAENTSASATVANIPPEVLKDTLGDLKAVDFADIDYIVAQGGKELSDFSHFNTSLLQQAAKHRLVFLFDQAIVVYNYITGKVLSILRTNQDYFSVTTMPNNNANAFNNNSNINNNAGKIKPTCWEWLTTGHLAIGCSDGYVRVFEESSLTSLWKNTNNNIPNKILCKKKEKNLYRTMSLISSFSVHTFTGSNIQYQPSSASFPPPAVSTGEVSILRLIPSILVKNTSPGPVPALWETLAKDLDRTVQLLSVSSDGSVFAWRLTYVAHWNLSAVESGFVGTDCPVSRLGEGILGGLSLASAAANSSTAQSLNPSTFNTVHGTVAPLSSQHHNANAARGAEEQAWLGVGDVSVLLALPLNQQSVITNPIPARFDRQHRFLIDSAFAAQDKEENNHVSYWSNLLKTHFPVCPWSLKSLTLQVLVAEGVIRLFDLTTIFFLPLLLSSPVASDFQPSLSISSNTGDLRRNSFTVEANALENSGKKEKKASIFGSVFKGKASQSTASPSQKPTTVSEASQSMMKVTNNNSATVIYHISAYASVKPGKQFPDNLRKNAFVSMGLIPLPLSLTSSASSSACPISGMYCLPAKHDELAVVYNAQMAQALFHHHRQHLLWLQGFLKACNKHDTNQVFASELKTAFENVLASLESHVNNPVNSTLNINNIYTISTNMELFDINPTNNAQITNAHNLSASGSWVMAQEDEQQSVVSSSINNIQGVHHVAKRSSLKRFSSSNMNNLSAQNMNNASAVGNHNSNNTSGNLYGINVKQMSAWRLDLVHSWPSITELVVAYLEKLFSQQAVSLRETSPSSYVSNRMAALKDVWSYDKTDKLKLYGVSLHSATNQIVCSTNIGAIVLNFAYCYPQNAQNCPYNKTYIRYFPSSSGIMSNKDTLSLLDGEIISDLSIVTYHPIDNTNDDNNRNTNDTLHESVEDAAQVIYKQEIAYIAELHVLRRRITHYRFSTRTPHISHDTGNNVNKCEVMWEENMKLPPIPVSLSLSSTTLTHTTNKTQTNNATNSPTNENNNVFVVSQGGSGVRPIMKRSLCGTAVSLLFPTHQFYLICTLPRIYRTTAIPKPRHSETAEFLKETVSGEDAVPEDVTENIHFGTLKLLAFGRASHIAWTLAENINTADNSNDTTNNTNIFKNSVCLLRIPRHSVAETDATITTATQIALSLQLQRDKEQQKKNKRLSMLSTLMNTNSNNNNNNNQNTQYLNVRKDIPAYLAAKLLSLNAHGKLAVKDVPRISLQTLLSMHDNDTVNLTEEIENMYSGPVTTVSYSFHTNSNNYATTVSQMFALSLKHTVTPSSPSCSNDPENNPESQKLFSGELTAVSPLLPAYSGMTWFSSTENVAVVNANTNDHDDKSLYRYVAVGASDSHTANTNHATNETAVYRLSRTAGAKEHWRLEVGCGL